MGNFHPLTVHFPIALLSLYSVLELISFGRLKSNISWFWMKFLLVTLGGISLLVARQTGDIAGAVLSSDSALRALVEKHEQFANITTAIYGILAAGYVFSGFERLDLALFRNIFAGIWQVLAKLGNFFTQTVLGKLLALIGAASLLITGALGASLVYGPNWDFFTRFIYHLFL